MRRRVRAITGPSSRLKGKWTLLFPASASILDPTWTRRWSSRIVRLIGQGCLSCGDTRSFVRLLFLCVHCFYRSLARVGRPWNTSDRRDPRSFLRDLKLSGYCWIQVRKILTASPFAVDLTRDGFKWYEFMNGYGGGILESRRFIVSTGTFKGFVLGRVCKNFHFYIAFCF